LLYNDWVKMDGDKLNLLLAFESWDYCRELCKNLTQVLNDANDSVVAVLALEGLNRIERGVGRGQFPPESARIVTQEMRNLLRKWRNEGGIGVFRRVNLFLRQLTIFKTLEVPLFIDDYGDKKLLSSYEEIEDISIDVNTPIFHVTHCEEAERIVNEKRLKPSDNKNIMEGWSFGLDNSNSVYGSKAFQTTLSRLGVTGLRQGEIVSYEEEVNVILYAVTDLNDAEFRGLKKPKLADDAVKKGAYVKVSIFQPSRF
jgi:hypothetical protein